MWGVGSWRETGKQNYGVSLPTRMVRICTGNTASLRKWFRGLTCGSRSCGGEEAGCFGGGSQHGVTFYVVSLKKISQCNNFPDLSDFYKNSKRANINDFCQKNVSLVLV